MAYVQEADAWRTASVMHDAVFAAERLCNDVYRAISDAYKPGGDSSAVTTAASPDIRAKAEEARRCLYAAVNYLTVLIGDEPSS